MVLDAGCAPPDPRIGTLVLRLHALSGSEGYYARREMAAAAKDRDELVLRLVARDAAVARCAPEGPALAERRRVSTLLIGALLDGKDPLDWQQEVVVYDLRLQPIWLPFGHRVCSGHGFEGAAECFAFGFPAVIADVVTFPLGTWIWAAKDQRDRVGLGSHAPSLEVQRATPHIVALRRQTWAAHAGRPSEPRPASSAQ